MSANGSQVMATIENFNPNDFDIERFESQNEGDEESQRQEQILNIGEFVFNHITAESNGSCIKAIRRKVAIHSKCLIKACTIADVMIYICFLFLSLFLLVQKDTIIPLKLHWLVYFSLIITFLNGIVCIWILKLVIEAGYEHKTYCTYLVYRLSSIGVILFLVLLISYDHLGNPPNGLSGAKEDILVYYMQTSIICSYLMLIYIGITTIVYSFHLSIVKEFYKIVSVILESQDRCKSNKKDLDIGVGIPECTIGMPYYEDPKIVKNMDDEQYAISMKPAKFEVEIELEHEREPKSQLSFRNDSFFKSTKEVHKIKIFECPSESSEASDSYRIKPSISQSNKNDQGKIIRGRKLTLGNEKEMIGSRKISENVHDKACIRPIELGPDDCIEEESSEKYGLDYLDHYQNTHKEQRSIVERKTAFTTEEDMIASPVSKLSMKKKVSVKHVTRRKSFNSGKMVRVRSFTMAEPLEI